MILAYIGIGYLVGMMLYHFVFTFWVHLYYKSKKDFSQDNESRAAWCELGYMLWPIFSVIAFFMLAFWLLSVGSKKLAKKVIAPPAPQTITGSYIIPGDYRTPPSCKYCRRPIANEPIS